MEHDILIKPSMPSLVSLNVSEAAYLLALYFAFVEAVEELPGASLIAKKK